MATETFYPIPGDNPMARRFARRFLREYWRAYQWVRGEIVRAAIDAMVNTGMSRFQAGELWKRMDLYYQVEMGWRQSVTTP